MTSLQLTKAEAKEASMCCGPDSDSDLPRYPYGLTIYLDDESLEKLGITDLPAVGSTMLAQIKLTVTGTSQRATQPSKESGEATETKTSCVDLQITDMDIAGPAKDSANVMYPSK